MIYENDEIAVIGLGCRFPGGSNTVEEFWKNIKAGKDCVTEIPGNRWSMEEFYHYNEDVPGKSKSKCGGFIDKFDQFDASFFGMNTREAEQIDPQQRQVLEIVWEAFEDAGLKPADYIHSDTGVFMGGFTLDYQILQFSDPLDIATHTAVGSMMTMLSNRISYIYDFIGPSMSIDTACSSSLVALHEACQSLKNAECGMAIAGGIELVFTPEYFVAESKGGFLSKDGRCKTFDKDANGYVRGEGGGVVILKRLKDAIKDNNHIYAVIKETLVNQDGKTVGITVPNGDSQKKLLEDVYQRANIKPEDVSYVEVHGTGTGIGDPIESNVIADFFGGERKDDKCIISSVKANIGHLEAASGMASIIKVICSMRDHIIAPHIGMKEINPKIELEGKNIRIPLELEEWKADGKKRIAGVNSFGFGGTNAHAILEEYVPEKKEADGHRRVETRPDVLHISGKSEVSVKKMVEQYLELLKNTEESLDNVCYQAQTKRESMFNGVSFIGSTKDEMIEHMNHYLDQVDDEAVVTGTQKEDKKLVYVFSGMGPQWYGMGYELFKQDQVFHDSIVKIDQAFSKYLDWSIVDELLSSEEDSRISRTDVAQPMNFAIQVAVSEMLESMGVKPDAIVGHSVGEVSSFYIAGVYTLDEAVRISYHRSKCQHKLADKGGMLAVGLSEQDVQEYITGMENEISVAAINSNTSVSLSGNVDCLHKVAEKLEEDQVFNRFLKVNIPFHSVCMEEIKDEFAEGVGKIEANQAKIRLYTTAEGELSDGTDLNEDYWWKNMRNSVHFAKAIEQLLDEGYTTYVEIGPHPVLGRSIKELAAEKEIEVTTISTLVRKKTEMTSIYQTLASLINQGYDVELDKLYEGNFNDMVLPLYQWEHKRYWKEPEVHERKRLGKKEHPLLGYKADSIMEQWDAEINDYVLPFIKDHIINGKTLIAGAQYIETAMQLLKRENGENSKTKFELCGIEFVRATYLNEFNIARLSTCYDNKTGDIQIYQKNDAGNYILSFQANAKRRQLAPVGGNINIEKYKQTGKELAEDKCYEMLDSIGYNYGTCFRGIEKAWVKGSEVFAKLHSLEELGTKDFDSVLHTVLLDAAFQCMILSQFKQDGTLDTDEAKLPVSIDRITVYKKVTEGLYALASLFENTDKNVVGNITIYNQDGEKVADIKGFVAKTMDNENGRVVLSQNELNDWCYQVEWEERAKEDDEINQGEVDEYDNWIIFADQKGYGEKVKQELESRGKNCTLFFGNYTQGKQDAVDLNEYSEVLELCNNNLEEEKSYGVIYMCGLDVAFSGTETDVNEIMTGKKILLNPIRHILNALNEIGITYHMWNVTENAQRVEDGDQINVNQAAVIGMNRVIAQNESITTWAANIDVDGTEESWSRIYEDLLKVTSENEVAYRNGKRYIARLQHTKAMDSAIPLMIYDDKTYVLTGGLGSLGRITTSWLLEKGAKNIILIGRSELKEGSEQAEYIESLNNNNVYVSYYPMDVMKTEEVESLFAQLRDENKKVGGVFQIAGVLKDDLLMSMTQEEFDAVFDPKAVGAWNLSQATWNDDLDFFVTYSSAGAVVTAVGQVNYAAGNSFMDGLAQFRVQNGRQSQSIAWGPWAAGMIEQMNLTDYYRDVRGMTPILDSTGMQALEAVLGQESPHFVICGTNWPLALTNYPGKPPLFNHLAMEDENGEQGKDEVDIITELALEEEEKTQKEILLDFLTDIVVEVTFTQKESIHPNWSLSSIGIDSIMATEIRNKVNNRCGVTIAISDILGGASFEKLVDILFELVVPYVNERRVEIIEMLDQME